MGWGFLAFAIFVFGGIVILRYALWLGSRYRKSAAPVESDAERGARSAEGYVRRDAVEERRRTGTG